MRFDGKMEEKEEDERMIMRSMAEAEKKEMEQETFMTYWMQKENSEYYEDIAIYTVEVPVREHKKPEVVEAKQREIENILRNMGCLKKYQMKDKTHWTPDG